MLPSLLSALILAASAQVIEAPTLAPGCHWCGVAITQGGGQPGQTWALGSYYVNVPAKQDGSAFPRALAARIEAWCNVCQPVALSAQAKGISASGTVWAANMEAYSEGRATVNEFNIGARNGGYVLDVVPVRMPDGTSSKIDAVLKVEGQNGDNSAAIIGTYIDARVNPQRALIVIPSDQGPVTVMQTSDGRMKWVWSKDAAGVWTNRIETGP